MRCDAMRNRKPSQTYMSTPFRKIPLVSCMTIQAMIINTVSAYNASVTSCGSLINSVILEEQILLIFQLLLSIKPVLGDIHQTDRISRDRRQHQVKRL